MGASDLHGVWTPHQQELENVDPSDFRRFFNDRLSRVERFAFGNGKPGADERLRNIERSQAETASAVETLVAEVRGMRQEQRDKKNQWKGARLALIVGVTVLSIITGGSAAAIWRSAQQILHALPGG